MVEMRAAAKEIETRTKERVNFRFYGGGVQGNDKQVQRKMRIGQIHGATFTSGALSRFAPDLELYALPLVFNNMEEVRYVRERMDRQLRNLLEQNGQINFGIAGAGISYLMSNKPLRSLSDMAGQKTWVQEGDQISYATLRAFVVCHNHSRSSRLLGEVLDADPVQAGLTLFNTLAQRDAKALLASADDYF